MINSVQDLPTHLLESPPDHTPSDLPSRPIVAQSLQLTLLLMQAGNLVELSRREMHELEVVGHSLTVPTLGYDAPSPVYMSVSGVSATDVEHLPHDPPAEDNLSSRRVVRLSDRDDRRIRQDGRVDLSQSYDTHC